jgi:hypothetical protein
VSSQAAPPLLLLLRPSFSQIADGCALAVAALAPQPLKHVGVPGAV